MSISKKEHHDNLSTPFTHENTCLNFFRKSTCRNLKNCNCTTDAKSGVKNDGGTICTLPKCNTLVSCILNPKLPVQ